MCLRAPEKIPVIMPIWDGVEFLFFPLFLLNVRQPPGFVLFVMIF